jgi:hypothetical protein
MTLDELDNALVKVFGFDFKYDECKKIRDIILGKHGTHLLEMKKDRCSKCWIKDNRGCSDNCALKHMPTDPVKASMGVLSSPNDISIFPFVCQYVVPVFEKVTGQKNLMEKMYEEYKKLRKAYHEHGIPLGGEEDEEK